eukprot:764723-Hanusia_phi.AAC.1
MQETDIAIRNHAIALLEQMFVAIKSRTEGLEEEALEESKVCEVWNVYTELVSSSLRKSLLDKRREIRSDAFKL